MLFILNKINDFYRFNHAFTSWTCENVTELHYSTAEHIATFQCSLHLCRLPSSTLVKGRYFCLKEVAVPPLQPLATAVCNTMLLV